MNLLPNDYNEFVLKRIKNYNGNPKVMKAGLLERISTTKVNPERLYPNPDDEFSMEKIGPSMSIVTDYERKARALKESGQTIFNKPVIVEKMKEEDGYLILNGHHRWYASLRAGVKKLRIKIVNLVHDEDLTRMMNSTSNTKRASFDLDEILLAVNGRKAEELPSQMLSDKVPFLLREGAPAVIRALQDKGYDIWVYTAEYYSEGEIGLLFELYDLKITGVVNGLNSKRAGYMKEANTQLAQKYRDTINIDDESLLIIHADNKEFDNYLHEDPADWAGSILKTIEKL